MTDSLCRHPVYLDELQFQSSSECDVQLLVAGIDRLLCCASDP